MGWKNKLYFGDNLKILRDYVATENVDLIYLDPPFNSNATYNVLFKEKSGEESAAQITAFEDTWQWSIEVEAVYMEIVTSGPRKPADLMQAWLAWRSEDRMRLVRRGHAKGRNTCARHGGCASWARRRGFVAVARDFRWKHRDNQCSPSASEVADRLS